MNYFKPFYSVLLTRPINQNNTLQKLIEGVEGEAIVLPTITIQVLNHTNFNIQAYLKTTHLIIIISQNAVWALSEEWISMLKNYSHIPIVTMGAATTQAAQARGLSIAYTPLAGVTSEQLLEIDLLQAKNIYKKNILILTGERGRDFLGHNLEGKGACVKNIVLYKRTCPVYTPIQLQTAFQPWVQARAKKKFICITSQNGVENLLKIVCGFSISVKHIPVIVPSVRVQNFVKSQGFEHVEVAASARDEDMLETIQEYKYYS